MTLVIYGCIINFRVIIVIINYMYFICILHEVNALLEESDIDDFLNKMGHLKMQIIK